MRKEKVQNHRGDIVEVEILSDEESRLLLEQSTIRVKITLKDALAQGHVPLDVFVRGLTKGSH